MAEKTIGNRLTFVSCSTYAERKGRIAANPFKGLTLSGYGRKKKKLHASGPDTARSPVQASHAG